MPADSHTFTAELWLHPGNAGWHFVTLPAALADDLRVRAEGRARPFGSLPVRVIVGETSWETSVFADTEAASYLLPVKAAIRRSEGLAAGDVVQLKIELDWAMDPKDQHDAH